MLVLGRREGEGIVIADTIKVKVIKQDGMLRLAIDAPKEIPVIRTEIYQEPDNLKERQQLFIESYTKGFSPQRG
ncbi:carbon storage regulator [Caldalkalibacillus thermarum]|uniref:carbon storage regulator n=1 Tax=Caldalkalibacillus thermarum TaxID=296745 RepID=UPI001667FA9D|nr:carbon storage regulator [Caldalkalibacillus thermarum]GGK37383.1 carbon storage regulator [Caldalkalibacillus thermarum]